MLVTGLCFVAVNGIVRSLEGAVPAAQAAFIRFVFGLLFVVTVSAALFMGERLAARRMMAVGVALMGALIVLRPGLRELDPGHLSQILASAAFGASYLVAKRITDHVSPAVVVAMLSLTVSIGLAPLAWMVWVPPTWGQVAWLGLVAVFGTAGHYSMTRAFAVAPMTVTQPVTFLQLIWASLVGVFIFHEPLDGWVILGGGLMIGAICYITWREARLRARASATIVATAAE